MAARWGVLVGVVGVLTSACVDLRYPPGASRDGGTNAPLRVKGASCQNKSECQSGHCADGVCCATACDAPCHTCVLPMMEGSCEVAIEDQNPRSLCKEDTLNECGEIAACDSAGKCKKKAVGATCGKAVCAVRVLSLARRCTDQGVCAPAVTQSCAPFFCSNGGDSCLTSCTMPEECQGGLCENGTCGKKPLGSACGQGFECDSEICANNVCCQTACTGACRSCALAGSAGTCTPIPAGMPGLKDVPVPCDIRDASSCNFDGACDGAGACRFHVAGKTCAPASCANASLKPAGACDGKGKCQTPTTVTCGGYTCETPTSCRKTCNVDAECASPSVCGVTEHACGGLSAQYFRQTNLTDLAFMRTDARVDFDWMGGSPNNLLNADNFSVRWRGKITARFTDNYTFYVGSDDGERLWVGGTLIIDRFIRKPSVPEDVSATVMMTAGQPVDIQLEYFENGGDSSVRLLWYSKSEPKAVVPTSALSPQ